MTLRPSTLRSNTLRGKLLTVGRIRSLRTKTFDFDEVRQAHWLMESDRALGKLVVKL
jgi:NADPH:quinone reductase